LDLYRAILRELDKYQSPSFTFGDFNNFFAKGMQEYINGRYELFDTEQQHIDDLRAIVIRTNPVLAINSTTRSVALPADYWHLIGAAVKMRYIAANGCHGIGDVYYKSLKRMTADLKGFADEDYYTRPKPQNIYYKLEKALIYILFDDPNTPVNYLVAESVEIEYLQIPSVISITSLSVYTTLSATNCQFPDYVWDEIVNKTADIFLENIEQQRIQSHKPVNTSIV
jgi:hypothetical protein